MRRIAVVAVSLCALLASATAYSFTVDPSYPPADPTFEAQVCADINTFRVQQGLPPYQIDPRLVLAAENKARDMARWLYMDHDRPATADGQPAEPWWQHFIDAGYPGTYAINENLAYGFVDPQALVDAWASDVGHRANLLSGALGVGCGVAWAVIPTSGERVPFEAMDAGYAPLPGSNPIPPPPPPQPLLPVVGSEWLNANGRSVTVTAADDTNVSFVNKRGVERTLKLSVFLSKYTAA